MDRVVVSRMLSGIVSLGSASVIGLVLGLVTSVVIAWRYPVTVFGSFVLMQAVVGILCRISGLGLDTTIAKHLAETDDLGRQSDLVGAAIALRLAAACFTAFATWSGFSLLLSLFGASELAGLSLYMVLLYALENALNLMRALLQGYFRFSRIGVTDLLSGAINLLVVVLMPLLHVPNASDLVLARSLAVIAAIVVGYAVVPFRIGSAFRLSSIRELVRFGLPLQLNDVLFILSTRIDTLVIGALLSPAEVAVYEVARKIPDSLRRLYDPFRSVFISFGSRLYAHQDRGLFPRLLNDSARLVTFISLLGAAIAVVFGEDIISVLFSPRYLASAPVFALLMFNLCLMLVGNLLGTSLVIVGEPGKPVLINSVNTIVSTLGCLILTPLIKGGFGAGIGSTIGTAMTIPPAVFFVKGKTSIRVLPLAKSVAAFLAWLSGVLLLKPDGFIERAGFVLGFVLAGFALSIITRNDVAFAVREVGTVARTSIRSLTASGRQQ